MKYFRFGILLFGLLSSCHTEKCSNDQIYMQFNILNANDTLQVDYIEARAMGRSDVIPLGNQPYSLPLDMSSDSTLFILDGPSRTDTIGFNYHRSLDDERRKAGYCLKILDVHSNPLSTVSVTCHTIGFTSSNNHCSDEPFQVFLRLD
jgi:hypothetical protein